MILEIEMRAGDIPDGATVRKVKGTKEYTLRHELKIYYDWKDPITGRKATNMLKGPEVVFLQSNTSLNGIKVDKKLVLLVDRDEFISNYSYSQNQSTGFENSCFETGVNSPIEEILNEVKVRMNERMKSYPGEFQNGVMYAMAHLDRALKDNEDERL